MKCFCAAGFHNDMEIHFFIPQFQGDEGIESGEKKYIFHQAMVEYGTHEYSEASILLFKGELKTLREMYEEKLVLENWC